MTSTSVTNTVSTTSTPGLTMPIKRGRGRPRKIQTLDPNNQNLNKSSIIATNYLDVILDDHSVTGASDTTASGQRKVSILI